MTALNIITSVVLLQSVCIAYLLVRLGKAEEDINDLKESLARKRAQQKRI